MMKQVFSAFCDVGKTARRVMLAGLLPALFLLLAAVGLHLQTRVSYADFVLSRQICKTAVTLFSEGLVLGLFLDAVLKRS
ncbi:MAG: hypothetical protein IJN25_04895 [Clostridia bacterium]|nr:hypothetical protein [Oscillospiraceae bacterium]MBQ7032981.1 hypothetical protein [Clostridia bacterium]